MAVTSNAHLPAEMTVCTCRCSSKEDLSVSQLKHFIKVDGTVLHLHVGSCTVMMTSKRLPLLVGTGAVLGAVLGATHQAIAVQQLREAFDAHLPIAPDLRW